jgi:hypothetical protein
MSAIARYLPNGAQPQSEEEAPEVANPPPLLLELFW